MRKKINLLLLLLPLLILIPPRGVGVPAPPPQVSRPFCECPHLAAGRSGREHSLVPAVESNSTEVPRGHLQDPDPPVTSTTEKFTWALWSAYTQCLLSA